MKKIFTLIAAFMAVAGAYAQDLTACLNDSYAGKVIVSINEAVAEPVDANVTITKKAGNKIDFTLRNFVLVDEGDMMPVGNVELVDIDLVAAADGKGVTFATTQDIMIGEGDLEGVDLWMGPLICLEGAIPVVLAGKADGDDVDIDIDIDLPALGQVVHVDFIAGADPSGIKSVNAVAKNNGVEYNVLGQAVKNIKGIVIKNGRKFIK